MQGGTDSGIRMATSTEPHIGRHHQKHSTALQRLSPRTHFQHRVDALLPRQSRKQALLPGVKSMTGLGAAGRHEGGKQALAPAWRWDACGRVVAGRCVQRVSPRAGLGPAQYLLERASAALPTLPGSSCRSSCSSAPPHGAGCVIYALARHDSCESPSRMVLWTPDTGCATPYQI